MEKMLAPVALTENILRVDEVRNVLVLSGTEDELEALQDVIDIFDVDWLSGMSFGLFRLRFVDPQTIIETLERIFFQSGGDSGPGLVQFVPIERVNAVLVISQRIEFVERAQDWIERLDQSVGGTQRRAFVYRVQNSRAESLAAALQAVFVDDGEDTARPAPRELIQIDAPLEPAVEGADETAALEPPVPQSTTPAAGTGRDGIALSRTGGVRIIADTEHNAIIVVATQQDYRMIEATLRQLDAVPLQVLIQATLVEVTLTDDLAFGVRYFLQSGRRSILIEALPVGTPTFSYAFSSANFARSLQALATITDLRLVSSPELLVLDNQTAEIQVGDQVPVATRQEQSVTDGQAPVINSIQFRDTGVILRVTPRVNAGGLVAMDIEQEVSDVATSTTPTVTPTIFQRSIRSTVAVNSGETVALGGLISDSTRNTQVGVPLLMKIPILGALFRSTEEKIRRTELIVLLTPTVVSNAAEAKIVTEEMRRRMERVHQYLQRVPGLDSLTKPTQEDEPTKDNDALPNSDAETE